MLRTAYFTHAAILCVSLLAGGVAAQAFAQSSSSSSGHDNRQEKTIRHSQDKPATSVDHTIGHLEREHGLFQASAGNKNSARTKLYRDARTTEGSDNRRAGADRDGGARRQSEDHRKKFQRDDPSREGNR